jgi:hypothetical protein
MRARLIIIIIIIIIIMGRGFAKQSFNLSGVITEFRTVAKPATVILSAIFHTELLGTL